MFGAATRAAALLLLFACAARASPQDGWEIEVHGSWGHQAAMPRFTAALPADPPAVVYALSLPVQTQQVSSWFFGAGSRLTATANLFRTDAFGNPGLPAVQPIDSVLTSRSMTAGTGGGIGGTASRHIARRLELELGFDLTHTGPLLTGSARSLLKTSRDTFDQYFGALAALLDNGTGRSFANVSFTDTPAAYEMHGSAVVRLALMNTRRNSLYLSLGGGVVGTPRAEETMAITGTYSFVTTVFRTGLTSVIDETDAIRIHVRDRAVRPSGILGVGWAHSLSDRTRLRFEIRNVMSPNRVSTSIDASPSVHLVSDPAITHSSLTSALGTSSTPLPFPYTGPPITGIVFDNNQELSAMFPSSLTGPVLHGFQTFSSSGFHASLSLRAGVSYRF